MPFKHLRLICPRCRHVSPDDRLFIAPLHVAAPLPSGGARGAGVAEQPRLTPSGTPAVLGALEGVSALVCANAGCGALYPVVEGIPVVFGSPGAIDRQYCPPFDILSASPELALASLSGQPPGGAMPSLMARLARYAWAGFHDWLGPDWQWEGLKVGVHAVEVMDWLKGLGEADLCRKGPRAVLGTALGREAWEATTGETVLIDAHLPSLQAAGRLLRDGRLRLLAPMDVTRWQPLELIAPRPPSVPVALICCDVTDPPFEADQFASVIALNLLDSVSDPYLTLGQAHALTAPGGRLTVTCPFTWRGEVTDRAKWLESLSPRAGVSPEEMLASLVRRDFNPPLTESGRREFVWGLRNSWREVVVYRSAGRSYSKPG